MLAPLALVSLLVAAAPDAGAAKLRVLVLDLEASDVPPAQSKLIDGLITESMSRFDGYDVVSSADLRQLVGVEAQKSAMGCDASSCLAEAAGALGARFVVFGNVGKLGTITVMTLSLFDAERASAVGRQRTQVAKMEDVPGAIDAALVALIGKPQRGSLPTTPTPTLTPTPTPTATPTPTLTTTLTTTPTTLPAVVTALPVPWTQNASQWRGQHGKLVVVDCPAGEGGSVYGGPLYTDDSSICASAVHAGFITRAGGRVTLQIAPGQPAYTGSQRNGVTSASWGAWQGSFAITSGMPLQLGAGPQPVTWSTTATTWRGQVGRRVEVLCPPGGAAGVVYGGDPAYTDDSSVCTAAVHAGRIGFDGGVVVVEVAGGRPHFGSTTAHGITTRAWERPWDGSFLVR